MRNLTENSFESLKYFHDLGLILVPLTTKDKKKQPLISYKGFKEKGQDLATLQGLYETYKDIKPLQWAVYCVNGIVGLDFDSPKDYEIFFGDIETLTTRSPSGGYHCFIKSLAPCKSFNHMGFEVKVNELCTVLGDGYNLVKDTQIKEFEDAGRFITKKFPKIKKNKELKDVLVSDVISKYTEKKDDFHGGWAAFCPIHGDDNHSHLYIYESTNSWYCFRCKKGGDAAEFIKILKKVNFKEAKKIIEEQLEIELEPDKGESSSQASTLIKYVESPDVELFHDDTHNPYARIKLNDHLITLSVKERGFKRWITNQHYQDKGTAVGNDSINSALNVIEAKACFDGKEHILHNRICWQDNAIWYDMGNWEAIKITSQGWDIIKNPPTLFKRYKHQKSHDQSQISPKGEVRKVLNFINIRDEKERLLFLVYLVSCFVPNIPHVIPVLHGEKGAAKSTLFKIVKELLDPSSLQLATFPRDNTELVQKLSHHYFIGFDNVSYLSDWQSDALCRACTGEGFSKRELYTDDEDVIYSFKRCIGLNGINVVATKADLLDRSILLWLERIPKDQRKTEGELWSSFDMVKGEILGGIFTILSRAMHIKPSIKLDELPRMADFTIWGCAIAEALGYGKDAFLDAYYTNIQVQNREAIEGSPVGELILRFMENKNEWEGKASELLTALEGLAEENKINIKAKGFPKAANTLTRRLNEIKTNLMDEGIFFEKQSDGKRTLKVWKKTVSIVSIVKPQAEDGVKTDDTIKSYRQPDIAVSSVSKNKNETDDTMKSQKGVSSVVSSVKNQDEETTSDDTGGTDDISRPFLGEVLYDSSCGSYDPNSLVSFGIESVSKTIQDWESMVHGRPMEYKDRVDFAGWYSTNRDKNKSSTDLLTIVDRIKKFTPEPCAPRITVEVSGEVSEVVVE